MALLLAGTASAMEVAPIATSGLHAQRMLAAAIAGMALAVAGVLTQAVAANPLADPSILGTSGGAYLGAQCGLILSTQASLPMSVRAGATVLGALAGAAGSLAGILLLTRRARPLEFLLAGFLFATVLSGLSTVVTALAQANPSLGRALVMLGIGDLSSVGAPELRVAAPLAVGALFGALLRAPDLDLLAFGPDEAQSLGLDVARARRAIVAWVSCAAASAVVLGGQIAFVGLLAPHLARRIAGGAHRRAVPVAAFLGGVIVLGSDRIAAAAGRIVPVPTGALTTLIGAPFFLLLLRARSRGGWRERS